jgi:hypothetical protein
MVSFVENINPVVLEKEVMCPHGAKISNAI